MSGSNQVEAALRNGLLRIGSGSEQDDVEHGSLEFFFPFF